MLVTSLLYMHRNVPLLIALRSLQQIQSFLCVLQFSFWFASIFQHFQVSEPFLSLSLPLKLVEGKTTELSPSYPGIYSLYMYIFNVNVMNYPMCCLPRAPCPGEI